MANAVLPSLAVVSALSIIGSSASQSVTVPSAVDIAVVTNLGSAPAFVNTTAAATPSNGIAVLPGQSVALTVIAAGTIYAIGAGSILNIAFGN